MLLITNYYSKVMLQIHTGSQFGMSRMRGETGIVKMQSTAFCGCLSFLEDSSTAVTRGLFILMATASIGMTNLERLITFLIL